MKNSAVELATPKFNMSDFDLENIYSPAEDSFLFIDALEKDFHNIHNLKPSICLEIGIGTGIVITALASALGSSCKYYGTDLNSHACKKAQETGELNNVIISTFCCDLASGVPNNILGNVDILLFNPPYVVTPHEEIGTGPLELAWAGGLKGREIVDRLFPDIPSILSPKGVLYLVVEKQNNPEEIINVLFSLGYNCESIATRKAKNERLSVLKFYKKNIM